MAQSGGCESQGSRLSFRKGSPAPHEEIGSMSTENDVPLGEGSRDYYERKFADRIRQVKKGGASAPNRDNGGSNGTGRAGCGVAIAIFILIRIVISVLNSHSHTPTYHYSPPPQFNPGIQKHWEGFRMGDDKAPADEMDREDR
jgi:hypothetical protein